MIDDTARTVPASPTVQAVRAPRNGGASRMLRRMVTTAAVAAMSTALLAVGAGTASADVLDPAGRQIHTTVVCDSSTRTFSLVASPEPGAVARVTTRSMSTGFVFHVPDLYPVAAEPGHGIYQYTLGPGRFALYIEYWWQDTYGNWLFAGEWAGDYINQFGAEVHECGLG